MSESHSTLLSRPPFGGHEKFTFRHGWLKKGLDASRESVYRNKRRILMFILLLVQKTKPCCMCISSLYRAMSRMGKIREARGDM